MMAEFTGNLFGKPGCGNRHLGAFFLPVAVSRLPPLPAEHASHRPPSPLQGRRDGLGPG